MLSIFNFAAETNQGLLASPIPSKHPCTGCIFIFSLRLLNGIWAPAFWVIFKSVLCSTAQPSRGRHRLPHGGAAGATGRERSLLLHSFLGFPSLPPLSRDKHCPLPRQKEPRLAHPEPGSTGGRGARPCLRGPGGERPRPENRGVTRVFRQKSLCVNAAPEAGAVTGPQDRSTAAGCAQGKGRLHSRVEDSRERRERLLELHLPSLGGCARQTVTQA